ncbi:MAG: DUF5916 domain-containing protein [Xanthomonadales bacterium]|nr:DUF5916 domain-containing protein [Xanthomonadales bacterium]
MSRTHGKFPALILAALSTAAFARDIPYRNADFQVDGVLNEAAWSEALTIPLTVETFPGENTPAPVATEVLLLDTGRELMVGFVAADPDPGAIRAFLRDRDSAYRDDFVGVVLDTFNDQRRALQFFANPFGAQMDSIKDDVNGFEDDSWDALWDSAGRITDGGYQVEMAIPYSALPLPAVDGVKTWGLDLVRFYPRDYSYRFSNNPRDRDVDCNLCQLAKVRGFARAEAGSNLEITPTLTATSSDIRDDLTGPLESGSFDFEPGVDLSWGVTPNMTLNATLNPDFSQVEADSAQLNVNNNFALFFEEKRPFFLEDLDYFKSPINVIYTRNVVDPDFGIRLTGKEGPNAFGMFAARDTVTSFILPGALESDLASLDQESDNAVFRYRRDLPGNSTVGTMLSMRRGNGYHNTVGGIDGRIRLSESDRLDFQYLASDSENPEELVTEFGLSPEQSGDALRILYVHDERDWFALARYENLARDFRADLGFVSQVDFDRTVAGAGYRWYGGQDDWWNQLVLESDWDIQHDQSGRVLEKEWEAKVTLQGPLQSFYRLTVGTRERFWEGQLFPEDFIGFFGKLEPRSGMRLELSANFGDQVDFANSVLGERTRLNPEIALNIGRHLFLDLEHTYQKLDRDEGNIFTANLTDLRLSYQFDLKQRLKLALQYRDVERNQALYLDQVDARTRQLNAQLIYSYKVNPRTVLFAGYSESGLEDDEVVDLVTTSRTLFFKLGYAWEA